MKNLFGRPGLPGMYVEPLKPYGGVLTAHIKEQLETKGLLTAHLVRPNPPSPRNNSTNNTNKPAQGDGSKKPGD